MFKGCKLEEEKWRNTAQGKKLVKSVKINDSVQKSKSDIIYMCVIYISV